VWKPVCGACSGKKPQLREQFPALKSRLPSLWSRSYYVGSAGAVSAATIQKYIEQQKES
jgi:putative transposase